jgi:uncharacterized repeat protein (TIGR01451 family)
MRFAPATIRAALLMALAAPAVHAAEVTVQNDSVSNFDTAVIVSGFSANEEAASWLTSPCDGSIRAVQIFWRSLSGTATPEFGEAIHILRGGTFPTPGALAQDILGPLLTDNVINEFRFLDENSTVPVNVPVVANETFVVSLAFDVAPPGTGPSVVRDTSGCQAGRNAIHVELAPGVFQWISSCTLGVAGDWVIRAVVDCGVSPNSADLSVSVFANPPTYTPGQPLTYTIIAANAGPALAAGAIVTDAFPGSVENITWTCEGTGAATCPAAGTGNISSSVNLPVGGAVTYTATGTVAIGTSAPITNAAAVFPPSGVSDGSTLNNTSSVTTNPAPVLVDPVFANSFED